MQAQNYNWAQRIGNKKSDKATCIKTDSAGYIYVAGYFSDSSLMGTNNVVLKYTHNASSKEAFIAKFDSTGFCYWAKSGGETFDDRVLGMDVDAEGNSVITGTFWQTTGGFNIGTLNISGAPWGYGDQCFIVKHDKNGNEIWGNFVCSNTGDDQGLDIAMDKNGNSYVVGFMTGNTLYCGGNTITATNTNTGFQKHSYWLAKINSAGVFQWAKCYGNLPYDNNTNKYLERDIAVAVDDSGGIFITGGFDNTWPFGTVNLTSKGGNDIFVMKYDTSGNFVWAQSGGSKKDDWSNGICTDKKGHVYVTGEHRDSLTYDTLIIKNYDKRDAYLLKIDGKNGKSIWGKRMGSNEGGERGNDVIADSMCNIYVVGDINENAKFGDNITTPTGKDLQTFVARITPEGKWLWVATGGGADSTDRGNAIARGKNNNIYTCGYFRSTASYGPTLLTSIGSSDGFFARLQDSAVNKGDKFTIRPVTDTVICNGQSVVYNLQEHSYFNCYTKTDVVQTATQLIFSPKVTTTYTLVGISKAACPDIDTITTTIIVEPLPVADFTINPEVALLTNPLFNYNNTSTYAVKYEWWYKGIKYSTAPNTSLQGDSIGKYCITLIAYNNLNCADTITKCGEVVRQEDIYIPTAFSPNLDNNNDAFIPIFKNMDASRITAYTFRVFDRWGKVVFETNNTNEGWKGLIGNTPADISVYNYTVNFKSPYGKTFRKKGEVTLVK